MRRTWNNLVENPISIDKLWVVALHEFWTRYVSPDGCFGPRVRRCISKKYSGLYHLIGLTAHNFWSWSQRVEILFAESLQLEKEKGILPLSWLSLDCQFQSYLRVAFSRGPFVFDLTARIMVASLLQVDCLPVPHTAHLLILHGIPSGPGTDSFFVAIISSNSHWSISH